MCRGNVLISGLSSQKEAMIFLVSMAPLTLKLGRFLPYHKCFDRERRENKNTPPPTQTVLLFYPDYTNVNKYGYIKKSTMYMVLLY